MIGMNLVRKTNCYLKNIIFFQIDDEWTQGVTTVADQPAENEIEQSTLVTTTTSENITNERTESDTGINIY
jgi:hypothetical protein